MRVAEIHALAISAGALALAESRSELGEKAWREVGDWVESFITASASKWVSQQLRCPPAGRSRVVVL